MQSLTTFSNLDTHLRKNLTAIFWAGLFFWSSMASQLPTLPLYIRSLTQSFDQIGIIMGSFAIGLLVCRSYLGKLSDRKGRRYTMRIGLIVAAIVPLCYALLPSIPLLILFRAIHGISIAAFAVSYSALISDLAPIEQRGEIIGYMSLVNPLGLAFGPAIGGLMQETWGYQPLFVTASLLAFAGLLLTSQIEDEDIEVKNEGKLKDTIKNCESKSDSKGGRSESHRKDPQRIQSRKREASRQKDRGRGASYTSSPFCYHV